MSQTQVLNAAQVHDLAGKMDDISHRICDVLTRYLDHVQNAQASQLFNGSGGDQNVATAIDVQDAQNKIQNRFKQINDMLRQTQSSTTGTDHDVVSSLQQVGSHIQFGH